MNTNTEIKTTPDTDWVTQKILSYTRPETPRDHEAAQRCARVIIGAVEKSASNLRAEIARLQAALADVNRKALELSRVNHEQLLQEKRLEAALSRNAKQVKGEFAFPEPVGMFAPAGEHGDKFPVWHRAQVLEIIRAALAQRVGCGEPAASHSYQELFDAIAAATKIEGGWISISVKAFLAALPTPPAAVQQSVGGAEPLPEGWSATHMPPWDALTDEAQHESRISVKREVPPFCDKAGMRIWSAPTLHEALAKACSALGLPAHTQQPAAVQAEKGDAEKLLSGVNRTLVGLRDGWADRNDADEAMAHIAEVKAIISSQPPAGELPVLPEMKIVKYLNNGVQEFIGYSEDQMREYGRLCRAAGIEEAAKVAEDVVRGRTLADKNPKDIVRGRWEGEQAASSIIASDIRALSKTGAV